jgi:hypothetical protein
MSFNPGAPPFPPQYVIGKQYIILVPDGTIAVPFGAATFLGSYNVPNPVANLDPSITSIEPQLLGMYAQVDSLKIVTSGPGASVQLAVGIDTSPNAYSIASSSAIGLDAGTYSAIRTKTNSGFPGNINLPTATGIFLNPYLDNTFGSVNATVTWKNFVLKAFFYI